jgi:hypothetical protein
MTFDGKKNPSLSAPKLEHSIRVKQMQKQTRKPQILQRLVTEAPSKVAMPKVDIKPPDVKAPKTDIVSAGAGSIGSIGAGGGFGRNIGGGGGYSDSRFFGENVTTRCIVICMDVSPSMVVKGVTKDVLNETKKMLENIGPSTKFNIVIFVDGAASFAPQAIYATQENKAKVLAWLANTKFTGRGVSGGNNPDYSGSTPWEAIPMAVDMGADTIFVLTDDPPYLKKGSSSGPEVTTHMDDLKRYVRSIESKMGYQVKIYPILYKPHQNKRGELGKAYYRDLAKITGGSSQVIMKVEK